MNLEQVGYILHERAQTYEGAGAGWLSIKSFSGGRATYTLGQLRYAPDDNSYLVLDHGRPYRITIEAPAPVESLCIFFAPGFAEQVYRSLVTPTDELLGEPQHLPSSSVPFFERTYAHDALVSPFVFQLRAALNHDYHEPGWLVEQLHRLMQGLLQVHHNVYQEVETLPATRKATREELYRRVHYARDYAAAAFAQPITLHDLAAVAGLSPNHLLRTFKQVFQQTPHQYLITQRLTHAQTLLRYSDHAITDICCDVGFRSLGTFSWLFRRRFGLSPTSYRHQSR